MCVCVCAIIERHHGIVFSVTQEFVFTGQIPADDKRPHHGTRLNIKISIEISRIPICARRLDANMDRLRVVTSGQVTLLGNSTLSTACNEITN